jgi:hypothetical protein
MLTFAVITMLASAPASAPCLAATYRMMGFLIEEAKGTRHEAQIADAIAKAGGKDKRAAEMSGSLSEEQYAFILGAPDSAVRALAISMLPERSGK